MKELMPNKTAEEPVSINKQYIYPEDALQWVTDDQQKNWSGCTFQFIWLNFIDDYSY